MPDTPISVTEAARNFSDCVNRVRYQGASFLLLKGGTPVARLAPLELEDQGRSERIPAAGSVETQNTENSREAAENKAGGESSRDEPAGRNALNW